MIQLENRGTETVVAYFKRQPRRYLERTVVESRPKYKFIFCLLKLFMMAQPFLNVLLYKFFSHTTF